MYWFLTGQSQSIVPFLVAGLLWTAGGWLMASALFRLTTAERAAVGPAIGLAGHLAVANLLARLLSSAEAFAVSALLVASLGLALGLRAVHRSDLQGLLRAWPQLFAWVLIAFILTQIGRGVSILDDRKNLSLISLMANGAVPPHFYMDASVPFKYHYGAQLLGAELAVLGGLMPWSTFDVSKGVLGGLAILLAWHVGRRCGDGRIEAWVASLWPGWRPSAPVPGGCCCSYRPSGSRLQARRWVCGARALPRPRT